MNVELTVLNPIVPPAPYKNKYVVKMDFMHGDADFYDTEEAVYEDPEIVKKLLEVLKNCQNLYPRGKGGYDNYDEAEGFWLFFYMYDYDEAPEDFEELDSLNWPCNEGCWSSLTGVTVTYFDANGIEHEVKVKYTN